MHETTQLAIWLCKAMSKGADIAKDGKVNWLEAMSLLELVPSAPNAFMGMEKIPQEWADRTPEQVETLRQAVKDALVLPWPLVEAAMESIVDAILSFAVGFATHAAKPQSV